MEWIQAHWTDIMAIVGILYALALAIVKLTPTPKDDKAMGDVNMLLKLIAKAFGLDLKQGVNSKPPSTRLPMILLACGLLMTGCVGTQALSPSQQYGIASSSARAVSSSIRTANKNKLISDEDFVAMEPILLGMFDTLRAMRTAILEDDPITAQWYLIQVQNLVSKLSTMQLRAKEMNDVSNRSSSIISNHYRDKRASGAHSGTARSERRQARLYARRTRNGGQAESNRRRRTERRLSRRKGPAGWRPTAPVALAELTAEVEYD